MPVPTFASLLNDPTYADLQLRCNGRVFKVHRVVVCTQVKFFAACMKWDCKEANSGIIFLNDDTPEILEHMVQFLYTGDYAITKPEARVYYSNAELLIHTQVHTHADKYLLDELRALSVCKFREALQRLPPRLFAEVFSTVMNESPEDNKPFQRICIKYAAKNNKTLISFIQYQDFCAENGGVCVKIMKAIADKC